EPIKWLGREGRVCESSPDYPQASLPRLPVGQIWLRSRIPGAESSLSNAIRPIRETLWRPLHLLSPGFRRAVGQGVSIRPPAHSIVPLVQIRFSRRWLLVFQKGVRFVLPIAVLN